MILTALRLKNFRQYKGTHELIFATNAGQTTTIVRGQNGAGKTNLFLALNWCLYGQGMEGKGEILSKGLDPVERQKGGFVEVHFRHEGFRYVARRMILPRGEQAETSSDLELSELEAGGSALRSPSPSQKLNTILPIDARQYFFFDGESIDEMSRPGHEEQVKEAIRSVLKLKVLERTVTHLNDVEAEFAAVVKKTAASSTEVQKLIDTSEGLKARISELKGRRGDAEAERASASRQLDDLSQKLHGLEEVKSIMIEDRENRLALQSAEKRHREIIDSIAELTSRGGPGVVLTKVRLAASVLEAKRKKGEIPSNVRETLIDDLLKAGSCICERDLDDSARSALLKRKKTTVSNAVEETILTATGYIGALEKVGSEIPSRLSRLMKDLSSVHDEMDDRHRKEDDLREKLSGEYSQDVASLEKLRRDTEGRARDLSYELGRLDDSIEVTERQQTDINGRLEKIEVQSQAVRRDIRRYELARTAADAAEHVLQVFAEDMRKRIEAETDAIFKKMIWKRSHFEAARILEDYRLDVIDRYGASALKELSAGERQLLSLAFIVAMAQVTGEEAPLVIDTPFGRISEEPLHNIAESLPRLSGQLVLLVTDRELDEQASRLIAPHVGHEYELDFDDATGITTIVETK